MQKTRNSSMELLRIFSMMLIILHHLSVHGFAQTETTPILSTLWATFIAVGGKIGVNVFVLISGYFLVTDNHSLWDFRRIVKLLLQVLFYSVTIFFSFWIIKGSPIEWSDTKSAIMPITNCLWWFASTYFVLYLVHPFLNRLLNGLDKNTYQKYLLLLFVVFSLISTVFNSSYRSNDLTWFIFLYSTAGYIRLHGLKYDLKSRQYFALFFACYCFTFFLRCGLIILNRKLGCLDAYINTCNSQEKLSIFLASVFLLLTFSKYNLGYNRFVNFVASTTFGVYLIHDNRLFRPWLWNDLLKINVFQNSKLFIPYSLAVAAVVFIGCSLIDLVRIYALEKPFFKLYDKYAEKTVSRLRQTVNQIVQCVFN